MTEQPAGEHHTGTLNLTGEGNAPASPNRRQPMADDRSEMEAARLAGLAHRDETRETRSIRRYPVKALAYLLAQYDRVVEVHEHVVMDTPEDRELHDRAIATFRQAVAPIRTALSGSGDCRCTHPDDADCLAHGDEATLALGHKYTAAEVKVLTEAALRLGRKEAGEEIAAALIERRNQITEGRPGWVYLGEAVRITNKIGARA